MEDEANPVAALSPYELRNLVAHLAQARRVDDVRRLLALETRDGDNAWYETKLAGRQVDSYAADVAAALIAVQAAALAEGTFAPRLGDEYRYALLLTSLNALASRVPPALLIAMLRNDLISTADALNYARRATAAIQRAEALIELLPALGEEQRSVTAAEIRREIDASGPEVALAAQSTRFDLLAALVPHVPAPQGERIVDELIDRLAEEDRKKESAYRFGDPLRGLADRLTPEQARRLFEITSSSSDELIRDGLLPVVAAGADDELLQRVLAAVREISFARRRAAILVELVDRFPLEERAQVLTDATQAALEWRSSDHLAEMLEVAPAAMRERVLAATIDAARSDNDHAERAIVLLQAAPHVAVEAERDSLVEEAVGIAEAMPRGHVFSFRLASLAELARRLPAPAQERLLAAVLEAARATTDERERVEALAELTDYAEGEEREVRLAEALEVFRESNPISQTFALRSLAPRLPPAMLLEAFRAVQVIGDDDELREALASLGPYLLVNATREEVAEAVAAAREVHHTPSGRDILFELARQVDGQQRADALDAALDLAQHDSSTLVCDAIALLAPSLDHAQAPEVRPVWEHAVEVAGAIREPEDRAVALTALAAVLPPAEAVLRDALAAARAIEAHHVRAAALSRLVALLDEPERTRFAEEALDAARRVFEEGHPAERLWGRSGVALNALASVVSTLGPDRAEALANRVIEYARLLPEHLANEQADVLATVADCYEEPYRSELRAEAAEAARSDALRFNEQTVLRVAPPGARAAAITEALAEARKNDGYTIWREIASALLDVPPEDAYSLAANPPSGLTILPRKNVLNEIRYLAPVIHALGGRDAIAEIAAAIENCGRWWP